jgi:hypothetical protein
MISSKYRFKGFAATMSVEDSAAKLEETIQYPMASTLTRGGNDGQSKRKP